MKDIEFEIAHDRFAVMLMLFSKYYGVPLPHRTTSLKISKKDA